MRMLGFVFVVAGLLVSLISKFPKWTSKLSFIPSSFFNYALYIGIGLVVVGILIFILNKESSAPREVPIYQGNKIVGYRRA